MLSSLAPFPGKQRSADGLAAGQGGKFVAEQLVVVSRFARFDVGLALSDA